MLSFNPMVVISMELYVMDTVAVSQFSSIVKLMFVMLTIVWKHRMNPFTDTPVSKLGFKNCFLWEQLTH